MNLPQIIQLSQDGDKVCALLGENLQEGLVGFGLNVPVALRNLAYAIEMQDPVFSEADKRNSVCHACDGTGLITT